jgi:putative peptidoglycan lipid II flippase
VNLAGTIALLVLLRRRIGSLEGRRTADTTARVVVASAAVAAVAYLLWEPLDSALGRSFPAQIVSLGVALAGAIAVYVAACRLLRVGELDAVAGMLRRAGH